MDKDLSISVHFRAAYNSRVRDLSGQPRRKQDRIIKEHLSHTRPVTEIELLTIRQSRRHPGELVDKGGCIHRIERDGDIVFVIRPDTRVAVTCYPAPYLRLPQRAGEQIDRTTQLEHKEIEEVFKSVSLANPEFAWALALHKLQESGYRILMGGDEREIALQRAILDLPHDRRKGTVKKWRLMTKGFRRQYTWIKTSKEWSFYDFDKERP